MQSSWIGRFAPTPSGPLHFGSLVAALGSYLIARQKKGEWHLRIEDLDPPREVKGATSDIIKTLEALGFEWDGDIVYQSQNTQSYEQVLTLLSEKKLTYFCDCSRKIISERNQGVYDNFCRNKTLQHNKILAVRIKFNSFFSQFNDKILGACEFKTLQDTQDFIIKRRDGLFAYQLAVVVDDINLGVNHVVRGADILDSTPRQNFLYHFLNKETPEYFHLPLVVDAKGNKLSKSYLSPAINVQKATYFLVNAYAHLGQNYHSGWFDATPKEFLKLAIKNFQWELIGKKSLQYTPLDY